MSRTVVDLKHELVVAFCELHGIPADDADGFVSHLSDMLDVLPVQAALEDVDFSYYEGFCRDQAVEAEVERHAA